MDIDTNNAEVYEVTNIIINCYMNQGEEFHEIDEKNIDVGTLSQTSPT